MSLDDRIQQLDERMASRFKEWVRDLHGQLSQTLNDEIARQLEELTSQAPDRLMDPDDLAPITSAASSVGGEEVLRSLHSAVVGIDRSAKQADILQALVRGGNAFASRVAIFLTRADQATGWSASGFGEGDAAIPSLVVEYREEGPWHRLSEGRSSIRLSAADCGDLCSRIEAPLPRGGVLIPVVLRDRVAAALYADRLQDDAGSLGIEGLQLLAYAAAQAIENLPFRQRSSTTPTLVLSDDEDAGQEGLGLWEGAGAASASASAAAAAAVAVSEESVSEDPVSGDPVSEDPVLGDPVSEDAASEDEGSEAAAPEETVAFDTDAQSEDAADSDEAADIEDEADLEVEVELEAEAVVWAEPVDDEPPAYTDTQELRFPIPVEEPIEDEASPSADLGPLEGAAESSSLPEEPQAEADDELMIETDDAWAVDASPEEEGSEPGALWEVEEDEAEAEVEVEPEGPQTAELQPEPELAVEPSSTPSWEVVDEPSTVRDFAGTPGLETIQSPVMSSEGEAKLLEDDATMLLKSSSIPPAPSVEPEPEDDPGDETHPGFSQGTASTQVAEPAPAKPGRASEVQPPSDVEGPGWAFSKDAVKSTDDDEDHKQAKRLARLLVSEIKLYNEEQVEQGQKNNDIYERLREDIDRSRQVYEDRVNERVRNTNDYFYQELVRTLAAGDPQALGI